MQPVHLDSSNFYMIENSKIRSKINYRGLKLVTYNMQKNQGCANVHAVPSMISLIHLYENIGLQYDEIRLAHSIFIDLLRKFL